MKKKLSLIIKILLMFSSIFITITIAVIEIYKKDNNSLIIYPYKNTIIYSDRFLHEENPYKYMNDNPDKNKIPSIYRYRPVNKENLKKWLNEKNSFLAREPYFESIVSACKKYNLNPCLLFAITGKEQGFVPADNPRAVTISNNPFNVFGSWQVYNTNIRNSAEVACETIIKISSDRPENISFLKWLNSKDGTGGYAEDENWWIGVDKFFKKLNSEVA